MAWGGAIEALAFHAKTRLGMHSKTVVIIGAGPAGLTAALELLRQSDRQVIVLEASPYIGGISKTVNHNGNRIDIGGHRFFSKSDVVMDWWRGIMPIQGEAPDADPDRRDLVMLRRNRVSRIYFLRKLFGYPISLTTETISNLGLARCLRIGLSYAKAVMFPIRDEKSLEDFFLNRFGRELYLTFFKDYTEKVWGIPCNRISAQWGAQRIKGLSILGAIGHFVKKMFGGSSDIAQKNTETSLIDKFLYPKLGPGQMWEEVARQIREKGGQILMRHQVDRIVLENGRVAWVEAVDGESGERKRLRADDCISSMPVKDLVAGMTPPPPENVRQVAEGLVYRDFISVGLLVRELKIKDPRDPGRPIKDNWIYIQEPDVKIGRLQIFNNWSPYMVRDAAGTVWMGLEYFVQEGDDLWRMPDADLADFAAAELDKIGIVERKNVLDSVVLREKKTYPAYFGSYERFDEIRRHMDAIDNLFLIGRNGMHRYNNQDHSMLTAIEAVGNILSGARSKDNLWAVNVEQEYHEKK
jgi:protoporphyrinogen oxidase